MSEKIVAVVSGGMDSVTMLHDLVNQGNEVSVISFDYGQKHVKELDVAAKNAQKLELAHTIVRMEFMKDILSNSALTAGVAVPEGHYAAETMKATVVPNRNMIMASIAIGHAVNLGFDAVALGVHSGDHAIYPDCRPEFVSALRTASLIANYEPVDILAPYLDLDKGRIIERGLEIPTMDYSETWTCYKGLEKACGVCGSCQERLEGFAQNGIEDPIDYETREILPPDTQL